MKVERLYERRWRLTSTRCIYRTRHTFSQEPIPLNTFLYTFMLSTRIPHLIKVTKDLWSTTTHTPTYCTSPWMQRIRNKLWTSSFICFTVWFALQCSLWPHKSTDMAVGSSVSSLKNKWKRLEVEFPFQHVWFHYVSLWILWADHSCWFITTYCQRKVCFSTYKGHMHEKIQNAMVWVLGLHIFHIWKQKQWSHQVCNIQGKPL